MSHRLLRSAGVSLLTLAGWWLLSGSASRAFDWVLPSWAPTPVVPADNPMTTDKVTLGRHLFYDKRLSANESMSCATCHQQDKAFTDGLPVAKGVTGQVGKRSAMPLANVAYQPVLTWANPLLTSLEVQSLVPIFGEHPVEMGMAGKEQLLFQRLRVDPTYQRLFARAFPDEARQGESHLYSLSTITKAIASFERSLLSLNSPYDRYKYGGDEQALSPSAKRGEALFFGERLECYHCHGGLNFTDNIQHVRMAFPEKGFHNTGLFNADGKGAVPQGHEGVSEFTGQAADVGKFKTPSLRNVAVTAPYMHDGSISSLREVIQGHYALAGRAATAKAGASPLRSELIAGFDISKQEVEDLIAFLEALTDETLLKNPRYANPWTDAVSKRTPPQ